MARIPSKPARTRILLTLPNDLFDRVARATRDRQDAAPHRVVHRNEVLCALLEEALELHERQVDPF